MASHDMVSLVLSGGGPDFYGSPEEKHWLGLGKGWVLLLEKVITDGVLKDK